MATFLSSAVNRIDKKGRVSVPVDFRSQIAPQADFHGIIVYPALGAACLEGSDFAYFEALAWRIYEQESAISQKNAGLARRLLGRAARLSFDPEGRVVLPAALREYGAIAEQVEFIGIGPKFQIWSPEQLALADGEFETEGLSLSEMGAALGPLYPKEGL